MLWGGWVSNEEFMVAGQGLGEVIDLGYERRNQLCDVCDGGSDASFFINVIICEFMVNFRNVTELLFEKFWFVDYCYGLYFVEQFVELFKMDMKI